MSSSTLSDSPFQTDLFAPPRQAIEEELASFKEFQTETAVGVTDVDGVSVRTFVNEFWTARQRAASSLHEVSYRACFKPQLPRFFIERLSREGEAIYDPFMGRGTTCLEAALLRRVPYGCDINPLSRILLEPRLAPPALPAVAKRLGEIDLTRATDVRADLSVFYHPATLTAICALREYLMAREQSGEIDEIDRWIRMVAINRLTGHSPGFFSVYTLPPNQAASIRSQERINGRREQTPPLRDVSALILRKSRQLLKDFEANAASSLVSVFSGRRLLTGPARATPALEDDSVALAVTSPPFLDVVNYAGDNWLRLWFAGIEATSLKITMARTVTAWEEEMEAVFKELMRVLRPGGHVAFEVGEVRSGTVRLEESVVRAAGRAGLVARLILINAQEFTKTANCWGVTNGSKGTNTNRVVLLRKPA